MCPELFWKKIDKNGPIPKDHPKVGPLGQCWVWTGCVNQAGYGVTSVGAEFTSTHRLAYLYTHGGIPAGLLVCHYCDTPRCCRPSHLFLGTNGDNNADRDSKGRQSHGQSHSDAVLPNRPRGSKNPMSRFTEEQVAEMRRLRRETNMTITEIAKRFGGSRGGTVKAIRGDGWTHVKEAIPKPRHFTKHSQETVDAVRRARSSGKTVKVIAQEFGLSIYTVNNIIYERTRRPMPPSP